MRITLCVWALVASMIGLPSVASADVQPQLLLITANGEEPIDGVVVSIKGQRLEVRLADNSVRWFTTETTLKPVHVGMKVTGTAQEAGDTSLLRNPTFSQ